MASTNYDRMGPEVRARCLQDDREFERAQQEQERERAARAVYADEQRLRAAIVAAEQRGEYVSHAEVVRTDGACIGRTRGEFVAWISDVQDMEDARERALAGPSAEEIQTRHAALLAVDPRLGRTKSEALAYFSAVQDIEDIESARAAAKGTPTADQEAANRALIEKRKTQIAARSHDQHLYSVARAVAQTEVRRSEERQLEQRYAAGEMTEAEYMRAARRLSA